MARKKAPSKVQTVLHNPPARNGAAVIDAKPLTRPVPEFGVRCGADFRALSDLVVVAMTAGHRARLQQDRPELFAVNVNFVRNILQRRLDADMGVTDAEIQVIMPNLDFGVSCRGHSFAPFMRDQRFLQACLDEACERAAQALGV